jgi:hypothetical protein
MDMMLHWDNSSTPPPLIVPPRKDKRYTCFIYQAAKTERTCLALS